MSKKGGKKDDKKGKKEEEPEFEGPNIYEELLEKDVTQIVTNLDQPLPLINKENIEFEVLTDRLQLICANLETDNKRLQRMIEKGEQAMLDQSRVQNQQQDRAVAERDEVTVQKAGMQEDLITAKTQREKLLVDMGKCNFQIITDFS